jgi:hypothetical protein
MKYLGNYSNIIICNFLDIPEIFPLKFTNKYWYNFININCYLTVLEKTVSRLNKMMINHKYVYDTLLDYTLDFQVIDEIDDLHLCIVCRKYNIDINDNIIYIKSHYRLGNFTKTFCKECFDSNYSGFYNDNRLICDKLIFDPYMVIQ